MDSPDRRQSLDSVELLEHGVSRWPGVRPWVDARGPRPILKRTQSSAGKRVRFSDQIATVRTYNTDE